MVKITNLKQRCKIVLNSNDAIKTYSGTKIIPKKVHYFDGNDALIVVATAETIEIDNHGYITGDSVIYSVSLNPVITGLTSGTTYYVFVVDNNKIKLCTTSANVIANIFINITDTARTIIGQHHKLSSDVFTTNICTNYRFNMPIPTFFNSINKLCVEQFIYKNKINTPSSSGIVYCKSLTNNNIYNSQGNNKGCYLLSTIFDNTIYNNNDLVNNSMMLPADNGSWIQNGIDIFVDSKKLDVNDVDINGCINNDEWILTLIIYDVEEYDTIDNNMDSKVHNYQRVFKL